MKTSCRKKILLLSPYFPYPPYDGGKVRMYNIIKQLSSRNEVYLLSYTETPDTQEAVRELKKYCKDVFPVLREEDKRICDYEIPRCIRFFYTKAMIGMLQTAIEKVKPDVIQIDFLIMTPYVKHVKGIPAVYTEHDMSVTSFEHSFHDRDLPEKERFIEWTKLIKYEKSVLDRFSAVITLTERDRGIMKGLVPGIEPEIIETGVDLEYYNVQERNSNLTGKNIVFVGNYRHFPNYDAFHYFVNDIFPSIIKVKQEAIFYAVGSGNQRLNQEVSAKNVVITGEVEDVRPYLNKADVFVAPVKLGGGVKGKVLEAMASGVPVVGTKEVLMGLEAEAGTDMAVALDEHDFALKTLRLLEDVEYNLSMGNNGRKLVENKYDWKKICLKLDLLYDALQI